MATGRTVHLVCNAHLDPVWLWDVEEGIAEALSTFRCAVEFCKRFDGYVFNHNEALLYSWVERYEPQLFEQIQRLVSEGKWHIMGGWYLQPDCNMPSGEALIRQISVGRELFSTWFDAPLPTTAINFDSFGHDRGLVQILSRAGYDSYLVCRPTAHELPLDQADLIWRGYDSSEVLVHRSDEWYSSSKAKAAEKIEKTCREREDEPLLILWGVGDHGGGASLKDLEAIEQLQNGSEQRIIHSTPEAYFKELTEKKHLKETLSVLETDLRPWGVGCYTSMVRIKQAYKRLESLYFSTEKIASAACLNGTINWPTKTFDASLEDLLFLQFHDILPGSSIPEVERTALEIAGRATSNLREVHLSAFLSLCSSPVGLQDGEIPIYVFNPHPYEVEGSLEVEFLLSDYNWEDTVSIPTVYSADGTALPTQLEKESANLEVDWRKRVAFRASLAPSGVSCFICSTRLAPERPTPVTQQLLFEQERCVIRISAATGLIESLAYDGQELLGPQAGALVVYKDEDDPWGITAKSYRERLDSFTLADSRRAARICGNGCETIEPVRIIEDGPVRSIVEAIFTCGESSLIRRYTIDKEGVGIEFEDELRFDRPGCMLKCELPTTLKEAEYLGQGAFGHGLMPQDGHEAVAKDWVALRTEASCLAVLTDSTYGSDQLDGRIRIDYLRTAAYAAHPIGNRPLLRQDRYIPRIDTGVNRFSFKIVPGGSELLDRIDRIALEYREKPYALSLFPPVREQSPLPAIRVSEPMILSALYRAPSDAAWVIRIYNPSDASRVCTIDLPVRGNREYQIPIAGWEVKSLLLDDQDRLSETELIVTSTTTRSTT